MPFAYYSRAAASLLMPLTLIGLVACGAAPDEYSRTPIQITLPTPAPTLTPPPKTALPFTLELRTDWLEGKPCAPPCWEGITPGKTRLSEALMVLNWHPQVRNIDIYRSSFTGEIDVSWHWNGTTQGAGELEFRQPDSHNPDDPLVTLIVAPSHARFTLKTIIDAYGEPSHIVPYAGTTPGIPHSGLGGGRPYYGFTVVYQDRGFYLSTRTYDGVPPPINLGIRLSDQVVFFESTAAHMYEAGRWDSGMLVPWQGEQDFMSYCRQSRSTQAFGQSCSDIER